MSSDRSYGIHTSKSDGDLEESWIAVNTTQSMLPVEPVAESKIRTTSLPSLFIEPGPAVKTTILPYAFLMKIMPQRPSPCKYIKAKVSKLQAMHMFFHCVERRIFLIVLLVQNF